MNRRIGLISCIACVLVGSSCDKSATVSSEPVNFTVKKEVTLFNKQKFQVIDGFGVNITPAQWRDGNLKNVIDILIDSLGCSLIRFDCFGKANWLDAAKQNLDGNFPEDYLKEVYSSPTFKDAWDAFRYINSKGIEPIFNISGAVPAEWTVEKSVKNNRLQNFDAYATMAVSLLTWAREKEKLKFSLFMPFNETDLGYPEGPRLLDEDCAPAINAVLKKLSQSGFDDIQCIVMDDSSCNPDRIKKFIDGIESPAQISGIGVHTYGNGSDEDVGTWVTSESKFAMANKVIQQGALAGKSLLLTEYGDLDQSGEIEFEFGWRSTRRLLRCLNEGFTGGLAWDAFDNFHEHDAAWALYGLLETDTINWTYKPKPRFFAAMQVYKFIRPGFYRIELHAKEDTTLHDYPEWKGTLRNMLLSAYSSPDGKDFSLIGMSNVESDVELMVNLDGFQQLNENSTVNYYCYSKTENCKLVQHPVIKNSTIKLTVHPKAIFTITTL